MVKVSKHSSFYRDYR